MNTKECPTCKKQVESTIRPQIVNYNPLSGIEKDDFPTEWYFCNDCDKEI